MYLLHVPRGHRCSYLVREEHSPESNSHSAELQVRSQYLLFLWFRFQQNLEHSGTQSRDFADGVWHTSLPEKYAVIWFLLIILDNSLSTEEMLLSRRSI